jgi:mRNA interferase RelE/StbE
MTKSGNTLNNAGFPIRYHPDVLKVDLPRLEKSELHRVRNAIERKLAVDPLLYGLPLRSVLKRYWKLRVGNYRIVYTITGKTIQIIMIAHRREVYKQIFKRLN